MSNKNYSQTKELLDLKLSSTLETSQVLLPIFEDLIDDFTELDFSTDEQDFKLICENPNSKYNGVNYIGYYDKSNNSMNIEMKTKESIDLFHQVFKSAAEIDIPYINRVINDYRLMYAFILGENVEYKINNIEELKEYFIWNGANYQFNVRPFGDYIHDPSYFTIKVMYSIDIITKKMCQHYHYRFGHPKIDFYLESFNCFETLRNNFFDKVSKILNKPVSEIQVVDYKVLMMLSY
jgi:hypothetical protein